MSRESRPADEPARDRPCAGRPCRHTVTCLLLGLFLTSFLTLNFWGHWGGQVVDHGFPSEWMSRNVDRGPTGRVDWRAKLPLEWFAGDFSRVTWIGMQPLAIATAWAVGLVALLRRAGDILFGFQAEPFYRFGLGRLLFAVSAIAALFAVATESRVMAGAQVVFVATLLYIPLAALGVVVAWYERRTLQRLQESEQDGEAASTANDSADQ
jgi:hypothetical protein